MEGLEFLMLFRRIVLLLALLMIFSSCSNTVNSTATATTTLAANGLILYGSNSCGYCINTRNELDAAGIDYTFYDVNDDAEKSTEMWDKINAAGLSTTSVGFPVVDANGHLLIRPTLEEIRAYL